MKFSSRHQPSASAAAFFSSSAAAFFPSFSRLTCRDRDVCKMGQLLRSPTCQGPGGTHVDCPLISYLEFISAVEGGRDVCNLHIYCSSRKVHPIDILSWNLIERDGRLRRQQAQDGAHRPAERLHAGGRRQAAAPRRHRQGTSIKDL